VIALFSAFVVAMSAGQVESGAKKKSDAAGGAETFAGLKFRSIGPAVASGRVVGFAVHPRDRMSWPSMWARRNGKEQLER
jgi:hypothetical protein